MKNPDGTQAAEKQEPGLIEAPAGDSAQDGRREEKNTGVYTHVFKKPFRFEEKEYTELTFNFERLTGRDMIAIEGEMQSMGEYALAAEISQTLQCKIAAKAAGVGSDMIEAMPMRDFNRITNAARDFLLDTGY